MISSFIQNDTIFIPLRGVGGVGGLWAVIDFLLS